MNDDFHNTSDCCVEMKRYVFVEIFIADKTCPRKDLNFFHVWLQSFKIKI